VNVASTEGFNIGDTIEIEGGGNHESRVIVDIRYLRAASASASGGVLVLNTPLSNDYPIESSVTVPVTAAPTSAPTFPLPNPAGGGGLPQRAIPTCKMFMVSGST